MAPVPSEETHVGTNPPDVASEIEQEVPPEAAEPDEEASGGGRMTFLEHLDELRKRIVTSLIALAVALALVFVPVPPTWILPIDYLFRFIMEPLKATLPAGGTLIYTEPGEAFFLYFKVAALAALVLASPIVLLQVWLFIAPGLYAHEKRFAIPFVVLSTVLFVSGALFSHYVVFPAAWTFFGSFSTDYMTFLPRIQPTFSLYVKLLLGVGLVFQIPAVVLFLSRLGIVTARFLLRNTKYAILIIFIIAAVVTPSADPVTQTMMAAPMVALYLISILIAWLFGKPQPR